MTSISTGNAEQYADSRKLAARGRLVSRYTIAETPWFEWVFQRLPLAPGCRVLDIGCGPGWFWAANATALPPDIALTLVDLSPGMIEEALARCHGLAFGSIDSAASDAADLPLANESADLVIMMHMLYHVPDPARAIAEAHRVLAPGGILAVTTNGLGDTAELYALTTLLGGAPVNPAALAFGFEDAERLMGQRFGAVETAVHPSRLRITEAEDVVLAMTSFPPGDRASEPQLEAFRGAVDEAFRRGGGALETLKQTGLFLSRKGN